MHRKLNEICTFTEKIEAFNADAYHRQVERSATEIFCHFPRTGTNEQTSNRQTAALRFLGIDLKQLFLSTHRVLLCNMSSKQYT